MGKHLSDSTEQQTAESFMLESLQEVLGCKFDSFSQLPFELAVKPDAIDLANKIVVEVYARVGEIKGAQLYKIKGDILKLALIEKRLGADWRKIFCFASEEAANYVQGKSWVAEAAREFNVEIFVVELAEDIRDSVVSAQNRQRMVNQT